MSDEYLHNWKLDNFIDDESDYYMTDDDGKMVIMPTEEIFDDGSEDDDESDGEEKKSTLGGSADTRERRAVADEFKRTGKGQGYDKLETPAQVAAYRASYGLGPRPGGPRIRPIPPNRITDSPPRRINPIGRPGQGGQIYKKSEKQPLRDPKGGLTAAGRKYFKETEGANLKPGVMGPADTPTKMRRKGSFLVRFFTNPRGPMVDEKGRPTRLALSARAWGEPAPQNLQDAAKLAAKGRRLLDRYRSHVEKQKGEKSFEQFKLSFKQLGTPVGSSSGTVSGRSTRRSSGGGDKFNPTARDSDGDGNVQEGTDFMRAAQPRSETADSMERRRQNAPRTMEATDRARGNPPRRDASQPPVKPTVPGNIDLSKRKPVTLPNGEQATVRSMSVGFDDGEVLIPTIGPNGENWDPDTDEGYNAAVSHYKKTGQHLGKFKTPDEATAYGEWLHNQEAVRIGETPDPPANTTSRTWQTDTGSADTRERGIIREGLEQRGFDGEAFRKLMDAEARKLKPGQKTNWNPGRLPNGGKIAADGTYIPPDMVREDDKKMSDYYRKRRENNARSKKPKMTRDGTIIPDKNRDRIPGTRNSGRTNQSGTNSAKRNSNKPGFYSNRPFNEDGQQFFKNKPKFNS